MSDHAQEVLEEFVEAGALGKEWFSRDGHRVFAARNGGGMGEPVFCSRPGCGKKLRRDNTKGVCSQAKHCGAAHQEAGATPPQTPAPAPAPAPVVDDVLRRFRLLAEALGLRPDDVLRDFAQSWLDRALEAVRRATINPLQPAPVVDEEEEDTRAMASMQRHAEIRIGRP